MVLILLVGCANVAALQMSLTGVTAVAMTLTG